MRSLFARVARKLAPSPQEVDDAELTRHADSLGADRIADIADRALAQVSGEIRSLTLPATGRVPALVAELYDGSGAMTLVWLGRREIRGIEPGVRMRVTGRVAYRKGVPTMFNPQYELLPRTHVG